MTRILAPAAAGLLALTLLAGCSGGSDPEADPTPAPSTSSAGEPSTPASDPTPTVEPATGPVLDQESATLRAPEGWTVLDNGIPFSEAAEDKRRPRLQLLIVTDVPSGSTPSLAYQVRQALRDTPGLKRLPDVELDGSPAYHLSGSDSFGPYDEVGTFAHARSLELAFTANGYSRAERAELVASVLASFRWKS